MKPTKSRNGKHVFEDGEWWYYYPEDGTSIHTGGHVRERVSVKQKRNDNRMFVDGKHISKNHPLHKPGRYQGFTDAAFKSLQNYETSKQGQVYVIINPSFPRWCKVGMAVDANDRLKQYQTASPFRNYKLMAVYDTDNRRQSETEAHAELDKHFEKRGEWFACDFSLAISKLNSLFKGQQLELF